MAMISLEYVGLAQCDQCGWKEETAPRLWRWWGGEVKVADLIITDPCLCRGCLKKHGVEAPQREESTT